MSTHSTVSRVLVDVIDRLLGVAFCMFRDWIIFTQAGAIGMLEEREEDDEK